MRKRFNISRERMKSARTLAAKYLVFATGIAVCLGLSACGNWKPEVSGTGAATGSAVSDERTVPDDSGKVKPVEEPTLKEVEKAFHFAIGQEVYLFGGDTRDGFTGKKLTLYKKEEKDKITYFLLDCTDKKEHFYDADKLIFNKACEEPGFESFVEELSFDSEKEKKKELKGAEKLGTVDAWNFSAHKKPAYEQPTRVTKKIQKRLEQKILEDVKENLVCSVEVTYHAYIQYFSAADREALVYLVREGEKRAYILWYTLGESVQLNPEEYDSMEKIWQNSEKTEDEGLFSRAAKGAMAVSDIHAPATKLSDLGLSEEEIEQLKTICANRKTWLTCFEPDLEEYYPESQCMVSDLNQNGRLEVVRILPYGSGGFMKTAVFEVSEDGRSLVKYQNNQENPMEVGGPGAVMMDCYFDKSKEIYYYASENDTNADGYEFGIAPGRFYLKGDTYKEDYMKAYRTVRKSDGKITYYTGEEKISKSEYDRIEKRFWNGLEKKKVTFFWQMADDLLYMSDADVMLSLAGSWKGFSINECEK